MISWGLVPFRSDPSSTHLHVLVTEQTILPLLFSFNQEGPIKRYIFCRLENVILHYSTCCMSTPPPECRLRLYSCVFTSPHLCLQSAGDTHLCLRSKPVFQIGGGGGGGFPFARKCVFPLFNCILIIWSPSPGACTQDFHVRVHPEPLHLRLCAHGGRGSVRVQVAHGSERWPGSRLAAPVSI